MTYKLSKQVRERMKKAAISRPVDDDGKVMTDQEIADKFGVSKSLVWYVRHRFDVARSKGI